MIKEAISKAAELIGSLTSKDIGQTRVSQFANKDQNNKYACFFTTLYMYFRTLHGLKLTWEQYRDALKNAGCINDKFYIKVEANKGDTRFARLAGAGPLSYCSYAGPKIREKILELLLKGQPVPFSLNAEHFESIDGYETDDAGNITFRIDDPGGQLDTHCDGQTLEVFRLEKGVRKYSVPNSGKGRRKITRIYYFE